MTILVKVAVLWQTGEQENQGPLCTKKALEKADVVCCSFKTP